MSFEASLGLSTSNHLYAIKVNIVSGGPKPEKKRFVCPCDNKVKRNPKKLLNIIFRHYKRMVY